MYVCKDECRMVTGASGACIDHSNSVAINKTKKLIQYSHFRDCHAACTFAFQSCGRHIVKQECGVS